MNSMEEQALFEQQGWAQDLIRRQWVAPDGFIITYDDLMDFTVDEVGERALIYLIHLHGQLNQGYD